MKRILLALGLFLGLGIASASAQVACTGVGGINNVPQVGVNCNQEPTINTYGAAATGLVTAASATDVACIGGSATKVVRLQAVRLSGTAGVTTIVPVSLTFHTSPDTSGTVGTGAAALVPFPMDQNDATVTASTSSYSANPTLVTTTTSGVIDSAQTIITSSVSVTGAVPMTLFDWQERNFEQAPILRGTTQQICINFGSTSVTTASVAISLKWTEAPL